MFYYTRIGHSVQAWTTHTLGSFCVSFRRYHDYFFRYAPKFCFANPHIPTHTFTTKRTHPFSVGLRRWQNTAQPRHGVLLINGCVYVFMHLA